MQTNIIAEKKHEFRTCHLFAGAGGGLLADLILGHRPIIAVEWDKYACSVLRARAADGWFPDLSVWEGDVRMFDPSEYTGKVDCIHAGFPCQDISVAGKQAGVGEETRSGLYREVLRIADVVRPDELYLENVSAILSNGLGTVLADLSERGYSARWICLRASDVGANHGRDRWWLLARKFCNTEHDGQYAAEVTGSIEQGNDRSKTRQEQASELTRPSEQYAELAYSSNKRLQRCEIAGGNGKNRTKSRHEQSARCGSGNEWNAVESSVGFMVDGLASKLGRNEGEINERANAEKVPCMQQKNDTAEMGKWKVGQYVQKSFVLQFVMLRKNKRNKIPINRQYSKASSTKNSCKEVSKLRCDREITKTSSRQYKASRCDDSLSNMPCCGTHENKELGWWEIEPEVGRVATGINNRVGKLKALGNGQVPLQAAVAYSILSELFQ